MYVLYLKIMYSNKHTLYKHYFHHSYGYEPFDVSNLIIRLYDPEFHRRGHVCALAERF